EPAERDHARADRRRARDRAAPVRGVVGAAPARVRPVHRRRRHRLLRRDARAHARAGHQPRQAARPARRQAAAAGDARADVLAAAAAGGGRRGRRGGGARGVSLRHPVRPTLRQRAAPALGGRARARARAVHDRVPAARRPPRRRHRGDRAGQMEDGLPVHLGGRRVLLVLRAHPRGRPRLDGRGVARRRHVHRVRGRRHDGRRGGAHRLFALAVPQGLRRGGRRTHGALGV
ncbi:MAG: CDP-diacylglycerol--glycerol-3-phosphate 3-phosphatidyltransferase, partial [uncultured Gemmatimonadaceae bacterium]